LSLIDAPDPVVAFARGEEVVCAFNAGAAPQALHLAGASGAKPLFTERAGLSGDELWLGPWGWAILG
jgi:hypothetical protein